MNLTEDLLNTEFTQHYIDELIKSNAEESISREFKSGDSLNESDNVKKEIAKDVSAFANSDGGIIIYGVKEKGHKADSLSFIDGNKITKEWLEQVITSNIQRKIDGLIIVSIRYNEDISKSIYVVKIPRSYDAPHMNSKDNKYYKRYNFKAQPMEEYEVRDLFNRVSQTKLEIISQKINFETTQLLISGPIPKIEVAVEYLIQNLSNSIEKTYKLEIHIPKSIASTIQQHSILNSFLNIETKDYNIYSIPNKAPIFQFEKEVMLNFTFQLRFFNLEEYYNKNVKLKLYYSNGYSEKSYSLADGFPFTNGKLVADGIEMKFVPT